MSRFTAAISLSFVWLLAAGAAAQTEHGQVARSADALQPVRHQRTRGVIGQLFARIQASPAQDNNIGHGRTLPHDDDDDWARYPKFYGGFHSSHFTDVGVPHGDIGFRGNGIYWTPW